jgi:hypothetical protein
MPYTDIAEPTRMNVLSDKDEPKCAKSKTANDDPIRAKPYTDMEEPNRQKVLSDRDDPMWIKSRTERDEPRRFNP